MMIVYDIFNMNAVTGLLQGLTGVRFDAVSATYVDSKIGEIKSFMSTGTGFGNVHPANGKVSLQVVQGTIPIKNEGVW